MPLPPGLVPIVRVFTYRNYAFYMGGMTPTLVTVWMQRLGVGWLAWELSHSPTWLGIVAAADLAPMLVLAPLAGAVTDQRVPLTLQKITQGLAVLHSLALAGLTYAGLMNIWILFGLALFLGTSHTFASTARHALVPSTVPREYFATAVALDSALFNASRFVGPAVAGLIIPVFGVGGTFAANFVGGLVFFAALFAMDLAPPDRSASRQRKLSADIVESLTYVRDHAGIGPLFLIMTAMSLLIRPVQDMLPGFAGDVFKAGAVGLAWLTSSMGIGATVSAVWIAMRGRVGGLTLAVVGAFAFLGLAIFGLVATDKLWMAVAFSVLVGFMLNTMSTSTQALTQSAVDDTKRGRVMGVYTLIYRGVPAIGALGVGVLAELVGLRITFAMAAGLCLVLAGVSLSWRRGMQAALEGGPVAAPRAA